MVFVFHAQQLTFCVIRLVQVFNGGRETDCEIVPKHHFLPT